MIFLYVILAIIVVFIVMLYTVGARPYVHKNLHFGELEKYFSVLLKRGQNGGFMVVRLQKQPDLFLQFSKYIIQDRERGLQCDFPVAEWSRPYYDDFLKSIRKMGLKYEETPTASSDPENPVKSFVTLDLRRDIDTACKFTALVFHEVFGAAEYDKVRLHYGNVDARDIEI